MSLGSVSTDHLGHPSISLEGWSLPLSEIVNTKCSWDETELTHAGLALGQRKASSRPARLPTSSGPGRPAAGHRERQGSAGRVRSAGASCPEGGPRPAPPHPLFLSCHAGCSAGLPFPVVWVWGRPPTPRVVRRRADAPLAARGPRAGPGNGSRHRAGAHAGACLPPRPRSA